MKRYFNNFDIVITDNDFTYNEIMQDFKYSDNIYISTFGISYNSEMLNIIKNLDKNIEVKIFINLNKQEKGYSSKIEDLNPSLYKCKFKPYISCRNHSKVIMTDYTVYIGSQNYTFLSRNNVECGVITRNQSAIDFLRNIFFKELEEESIPYYDPKDESSLSRYKKVIKDGMENFKKTCNLIQDKKHVDEVESDIVDLNKCLDKIEASIYILDSIVLNSQLLKNKLSKLIIIYKDIEKIFSKKEELTDNDMENHMFEITYNGGVYNKDIKDYINNKETRKEEIKKSIDDQIKLMNNMALEIEKLIDDLLLNKNKNL